MERDLAAGAFAGCTASLAGQPLDTVRIRVQTQPAAWFAGARDAFVQTVRKEGPLSLFRGAVPPLLGMGPKNAVGFAVQGAALRALEGERVDGGSALHRRRTAGMDNVMVAGAVAGLAQCVVIVPSDRIKIQLQVQGRAMQQQQQQQQQQPQHGVGGGVRGGGGDGVRGGGGVRGGLSLGAARRCVAALVRAEGVRVALYRGWWPTVARQAPAAAVYFSSFEALKRRLGGGTAATALAGGFAGCAGYLCTYPLDVLKSAAMAAPPGSQPADVRMAAIARRLHAEHGGSWRWLVRGLGPTLARGFIINAVNFSAFEWFLSNILVPPDD
jgi:solute carrier family 25 (mitochondrial carnitine/acylcarnitine transporter), member 20/29